MAIIEECFLLCLLLGIMLGVVGEMMVHGVTGLLCKRDTAGQLSGFILRFIRNISLINSIKYAVRERAERFFYVKDRSGDLEGRIPGRCKDLSWVRCLEYLMERG